MEILIFNWNILIFHGDFPLPDSDSQILSFGSVKDQPTVLGQVDNQNKSETKFDILGMFFFCGETVRHESDTHYVRSQKKNLAWTN